MEKENRESREVARKEYNDTVKVGSSPKSPTERRHTFTPEQSLVMFVRKRDPRYKAHLQAQSQPPVALPNPPVRQANTGPATVYAEQEWQKASVSGVEDLEWALAEGNDDPEVFECVACGKPFKSEAAWHSHERSKKHIKNVEALRRQMEEEGAELGFPVDLSDGSGLETAVGSEQSEEPSAPPTDTVSDAERETSPKTESQVQTVPTEETLLEETDETKPGLPQEVKLSKRDKRKLREAKKRGQAAQDAHVGLRCGNVDVILTIGQRGVTFAKRNSKVGRRCSITSEVQATQPPSQPQI